MFSNDILVDDVEKANLLNSYFCSISSVDDGNRDVPELPVRTLSTVEIDEISLQEIIDILDSLKLGKASGNDGISHHMLLYLNFIYNVNPP